MDNTKKDYFGRILNFYEKNNRSPSYSELTNILNVKSKQTAYKIVKDLISLKLLSKDSKGRIIIKNRNLRVLGLVEAGFPSPSDEQMLDSISLDDWIIRNKAASFMLKVKGDSMMNAGILDGDMVVVERKSEAPIGSIIVANVDNAFTLKYLRKDKVGKMYLEAANEDYPNIYPNEGLEIQAVLIAVIRKY